MHRLDAEVRAGIGFGGGEAADLLAGQQRREVARLQLGRRMLQRVACQDAMHVDDRCDGVRVVGKFLDERGSRAGRILQAATAHLGREGNAEQPRIGHLAKEFAREVLDRLFAVSDLSRYRGNVFVGEAADLVADGQRFCGREQVVIELRLMALRRLWAQCNGVVSGVHVSRSCGGWALLAR